MPKRPTPKSELAFFLTLFLVFWLAIIKSITQTHITLVESSVIIFSAVMMLVVKSRVALAINGALLALTQGEPATLATEQAKLKKQEKI